jgi:short-subunit dehydrogenase
MKRYWILGNSDGIGLATTEALLEQGHDVLGFSRSESPISHAKYQHQCLDVLDQAYMGTLQKTLDETGLPDVVLYCVGMWAPCRIKEMKHESQVFHVNLVAAIQLLETVVPPMVQRQSGQILILSSVADEVFSPDNPAYASSKAGLSRYVESLATRVRKHHLFITNMRFGFVDTKLASAPFKPFQMSREKAAKHVLKALRKKPIRYSTPLPMLLLVRCLHYWGRLKTFWNIK